MTSGIVITKRIGQSAAKLLSAARLHTEKVQRLGGGGSVNNRLKIESGPTER